MYMYNVYVYVYIYIHTYIHLSLCVGLRLSAVFGAHLRRRRGGGSAAAGHGAGLPAALGGVPGGAAAAEARDPSPSRAAPKLAASMRRRGRWVWVFGFHKWLVTPKGVAVPGTWKRLYIPPVFWLNLDPHPTGCHRCLLVDLVEKVEGDCRAI